AQLLQQIGTLETLAGLTQRQAEVERKVIFVRGQAGCSLAGQCRGDLGQSHLAPTHPGQTLDQGPQLTHVAGPAMLAQSFQYRSWPEAWRNPVTGGKDLVEMLDQQGNVAAALAQCWHLQGQYIELKIQLVANPAGGAFGFQIVRAGGNYAHIQTDRHL